MAFLEQTVKILVYEDANQTIFPKQKLVDIEDSTSDTAVAESPNTVRVTLAASGSQAISFNGVSSVSKVYIKSSATDIGVDFNGLGDITYNAGISGLMPLSLTSLTITNLSSTVATDVTVVLISG